MKKSKLLVALTAALAILMVAAGVAFASGWRVVKHRSAGGDYATALVSTTINRPHEIAVQFIGGSGDVSWLCEKGFSAGDWSRSYGRGFHQLSHVRGKDSCTVSGDVSGQHHVTVEILTHR